MKRKLSFVLTLLIFGCILFSCNDTKENGNVVVVFDGNKFTVKHNGMLSRYYFSFSKRKDGFYDMYQGMIEYLVYFRKTKNRYTVNKASCTNSIETLNELGNILKVAKETYPIDSPDFVIVSPKNLHQRVWRFSDALPSTLSECIHPCSEVA